MTAKATMQSYFTMAADDRIEWANEIRNGIRQNYVRFDTAEDADRAVELATHCRLNSADQLADGSGIWWHRAEIIRGLIEEVERLRAMEGKHSAAGGGGAAVVV